MYEGYSNYETWAVALWMGNEYEIHKRWSKIAEDQTFVALQAWEKSHERATLTPPALRSVLDKVAGQVGEELRAEAKGAMQDMADVVPPAIFDLLEAAFEEVDWKEVAAGYIPDTPRNSYAYTGPERPEQEFNGWKNYPTWVAYSFFNGDFADDPEAIQKQVRILVDKAAFEGSMKDLSTGFVLDDLLKETLEAAVPDPKVLRGGPWTDLINAAIGDVDWYAISEALKTGYGISGRR